MRVGTLEIQIMAGLARLQKDMNDAQRMVGGAMSNVERSVASARQAMQALGMGIPIVAMVDQVRRMTDQYTKLDAQLRIATKSQEAYAQGMADIRRISTIAQADISATSMLYTRLINVMDGTGVSQSKLATVAETVSFGLKAYGATAQEASSAALQLSQAMGANRLGGEEFRAVMEAMPNVMKVVANSMGVPLGELRQLSIEGKITADVLVKALGDPAIAAEFKRLAESTQTVTGAWQVARNELMLLVGEFSKSSGLTSSTISAFNAAGAVFRFVADNIDLVTRALGTYIAVMAGKFIVGVAQARAAQRALNAENEAAALAAIGKAAAEKAEAIVVAENAAVKQAAVVAQREALFATEAETLATIAASRATIAHSQAMSMFAISEIERATALKTATAATLELAAAEANLNRINKARASAQVEAIAMDAALTRQRAGLAAATQAVTAAERLQAASSVGIMGRIKGLAGRAGWIGMALFGVWTVYDFLNGMQQVADGAKKTAADLSGMGVVQLQLLRNAEALKLHSAKTGFYFDKSKQQNDIEQAQRTIKLYDEQIAKVVELQNAQKRTTPAPTLTHDQEVMANKLEALKKLYDDKKISDAVYMKRAGEAVYGKPDKAALAAAKKDASETYRTKFEQMQGEMALIDQKTTRERTVLEQNRKLELVADAAFFAEDIALQIAANTEKMRIIDAGIALARAAKDRDKAANLEADKAQLALQNEYLVDERNFKALVRAKEARDEATKATTDYSDAVRLSHETSMLETSLIGKTALEIERANAARKIELDLAQRIKAVKESDKFKPKDPAVVASRDATIKDLEKTAEVAKRAADEEILTRDAVNKSWVTGARRAIQQYVDDLDNGAKMAETIVKQIHSSFADFLFDPFKNGVKGMLADFVDMMRRMAAEAVATQIMGSISGWGASQKDSGGILGAIGGIIGGMNFAGGGYTGDGPRSGGLDGQGGFLAMMHPRETVVDNTKPQSAGRSLNLTINYMTSQPLDRRTQEQAATTFGLAVQQAMARNA